MDNDTKDFIVRNVRVLQGETIRLADPGRVPQDINCDDIAKLALNIYDHSYFFSLYRGLAVRFCRDLNGSGAQGLYITRENDKADSTYLIEVFFSQTYNQDCNFLYEADLIMDRGKDYEPTVNKGKHRFAAQSAAIHMEWNGDETEQWRRDIERLSRSPDTLNNWIVDGSEMLVRCAVGYFCRKPVILTVGELEQYISMGLSLEDLRRRLTCVKCGRRGASVSVL